jgi:hypothetical protein
MQHRGRRERRTSWPGAAVRMTRVHNLVRVSLSADLDDGESGQDLMAMPVGEPGSLRRAYVGEPAPPHVYGRLESAVLAWCAAISVGRRRRSFGRMA